MYYIEMNPVNVDGMTCLENTLMTYVSFKNTDVRKMYMNSWSFCRYEDSELLGYSFGIKDKDFHYLAKTYYGLDYGMFEANDEATTYEIIMNELRNGRPLAIAIDSYYCPWEHSYHISHSEVSHFFNIIGEDDNGDFIVAESMPLLKDMVIKREDLFSGIRGGLVYRENENVLSESEMLEQMYVDIRENLRENQENEMFKSMRDFVENIQECDDFETEFKAGNSDWSIPLLQNIGYLHGSRKQYLAFLEYLNEQRNSKLSQTISEYTNAEKRQKSVKMLFYKMRYHDDYESIKQRICRNLMEAITYEENAADKLLAVL